VQLSLLACVNTRPQVILISGTKLQSGLLRSYNINGDVIEQGARENNKQWLARVRQQIVHLVAAGFDQLHGLACTGFYLPGLAGPILS